jgi:endonuclease YncB( thermonuclease family)
MNKNFTRLLLCVLSLLAASYGLAATLQGRVVGITDGDTVTVLDDTHAQYKIRLMGIDAPEKSQPFGQRSKVALSDLIYNQQVKVEYSNQDRYGRTVGKITLSGVDVNLEQIKAGMAWHYKKYQQEQTREDAFLYANAEIQAHYRKLGLWRDKEPIPPWEWRKQHKHKESSCVVVLPYIKSRSSSPNTSN